MQTQNGFNVGKRDMCFAKYTLPDIIALSDFNSMSDLGSRMSEGRPTDIFDRGQWVCTHEILANIEDVISDVVWMLDTFQHPRNSNSASYSLFSWNSFALRNSYYVFDRFDRHLFVSRSSILVSVNNCINNFRRVQENRTKMLTDYESGLLNRTVGKIKICCRT